MIDVVPTVIVLMTFPCQRSGLYHLKLIIPVGNYWSLQKFLSFSIQTSLFIRSVIITIVNFFQHWSDGAEMEQSDSYMQWRWERICYEFASTSFCFVVFSFCFVDSVGFFAAVY